MVRKSLTITIIDVNLHVTCFYYICVCFVDRHLYNKIKEEDTLRRFQFVNPFTIFYVPNGIPMKREKALADRLIVASPDQLVLVPWNVG